MKADFLDTLFNRVGQFIDDTLKTAASEGFGQAVLGSGNLVTESNLLPPFSKITVSVPSQVRLIHDSVSKIVVTTDDNLINSILAEVDAGTLEINRQKSMVIQATRTTIDIHTAQVDEIEVIGSAKIGSNDAWSGFSLYLHINGSGRIELSGRIDDLDVQINGSGKVRIQQLTTQRANVTIKGSGSVKVNAESTLTATVKGSGTIYFSGSPKVHSRIKGSGRVTSVEAEKRWWANDPINE